MSKLPILLTLVLISLALSAPLSGFGQEGEPDVDALQREEVEDYYSKWLDEDVVYVISDEERSVFQKLATPEEKERFIEQFWFRRDPDPTTAVNEFKEEHYRRIAYANERFYSGKPGWRTDRGRIYIIHGPPATIESHPTGGSYKRPMNEGGGTTVAHAYEVWTYRHIEGIGDDIRLEFVDKDYSGEYRLSHTPEDKDALLYIPGQGPTLAEELGLATRSQRPIFAPGARDLYPKMELGYRDDPFYRYQVYSKSLAPQTIKYKDLQELIKVRVNFTEMPMTVQQDRFVLDENQILIPLSIQVKNKDLSFDREKGEQVARIAVYGIVTSLSNRVAKEFDDDLVTSFRPEELERGLQLASVYQKMVVLDRHTRYKVDLVAKDVNSGHVGYARLAILPSAFDTSRISGSSLILSDYIKVLDTVPERDEMFVLGDVKVRPNLTREFSADRPFGVYAQIYNVALDQSTMKPSVTVTYDLLKNGEVLHEITDEDGNSMQFYSGRRVVLVRQFSLAGMDPGEYQIRMTVHDRLTDQSLQLSDRFKLVPVKRLAMTR